MINDLTIHLMFVINICQKAKVRKKFYVKQPLFLRKGEV